MKRPLYLLLFVLISQTSLAQQFINGSLEPKASFTSFCTNLATGTYNNNMPNATLTDSAGNRGFIGNSICVGATVPNGIAFTGLYYDSTSTSDLKGQRLALKLNSPLVVGSKYYLSFAIIRTTSAFGSPFVFGYMNDSVGAYDYMSPDTIIAPTSTAGWLTVTDSFIANRNDQFVFVEVVAPTRGDGFSYVDNFKLQTVSAVPEINQQLIVSAYPNPVSGVVNIHIDDNAKLPCTLTITDMLGREVRQEKMTENSLKTDMSGFMKGVYLLRISDKENNRGSLKLITQ